MPHWSCAFTIITSAITVDGVETESHDVEDPLAFVETFKARYNVPTIMVFVALNGGLVVTRLRLRALRARGSAWASA